MADDCCCGGTFWRGMPEDDEFAATPVDCCCFCLSAAPPPELSSLAFRNTAALCLSLCSVLPGADVPEWVALVIEPMPEVSQSLSQ